VRICTAIRRVSVDDERLGARRLDNKNRDGKKTARGSRGAQPRAIAQPCRCRGTGCAGHGQASEPTPGQHVPRQPAGSHSMTSSEFWFTSLLRFALETAERAYSLDWCPVRNDRPGSCAQVARQDDRAQRPG